MYGLIPFRRHNSLQKKGDWDFQGWLDDFFSDSFFADGFLPAFFARGGIRADVKETENEYVIEAEIPGADKDDIKLDLDDNSLTISVERKQEEKEERQNYIRRERRYGSYSRSFYVDNIKHDSVKAEYKNGILKVTLPKKEEARGTKKRIDIN